FAFRMTPDQSIGHAWQLQVNAGPFGVNAAPECNERIALPHGDLEPTNSSPKNLHTERHHLSCSNCPARPVCARAVKSPATKLKETFHLQTPAGKNARSAGQAEPHIF